MEDAPTMRKMGAGGAVSCEKGLPGAGFQINAKGGGAAKCIEHIYCIYPRYGWLGLPGQIQDCKVSNAIIALADKPVRVKSSVRANALFIAVVFCFFFLLPFPFLPGAQTSKNLLHAFQFRLYSPL